MHLNRNMRLLEGYHNMFRDIHVFSATTTTAGSVTFQHPRAGNCRMLRPRANKNFALFFFVCCVFSCENKTLRVFCGTMCVIIFLEFS